MPITPPENAVGGQIWSWGMIDCGPSIGLVRRPLFNDKYITTGSGYVLQPFDQRLILKLTAPGTFIFTLRSVVEWLRQPWGQFPVNFKDGGNFASTFPITIVPFAGETIDGLDPNTNPVQIISDGGSLTVAPKSDLSGWTLAP